MANRILKIYHKGLEARSLRLGQFILWEPSSYKPPIVNGGDVWDWEDLDGITWRIHLWSTNGSHDIEVVEPGKIAYWLNGAGGGGGSRHGGGGGAGANAGDLVTPYDIFPGIYTAILGVGGQGAPAGSFTLSQPGQSSTFLGEVGSGGGAGNSSTTLDSSAHGGCGGGGRGLRTWKGLGNPGFDGGIGGDNRCGGGGGSIVEPGWAGESSFSGLGGKGVDFALLIGASRLDNGRAAAGGSGGTDEDIATNISNVGGGGSGGSLFVEPTEGLWGSGGGAGGMSAPGGDNSISRPGKKGGDGFLLIRYPVANPPNSWLN